MIFRIKHRWTTALAATALLALVSWIGCGLLGRPLALLDPASWNAQAVAWGVGFGLGSIVLDGLIHGLCTLLGRGGYQREFDAHARAVFGPMGPPEIATGGLMAAVGEEPLFRGCLLPALAGVLGPSAAVVLSSLAFAGCHWLSLRFWPFWIWACGEGLVFGALYVATDSIVAPVLAHGIHDWVGYGYFWLLTARKPAASKPEPATGGT